MHLLGNHVKCNYVNAMLGGSEVVVGTSIASYDLGARIMVLWRSAAAPPPPPNPHTTPCTLILQPSKVILNLECPKRACQVRDAWRL